MISSMFNSRSVQRSLFAGAFLIGTLGVLSGGWQTATSDVSGAGGLIGGTVMLAVGAYGLKKTHIPAPRP